MAYARPAGAVAPANEEAARAWDTVLYERWKRNREVFVGSLDGMTEELLARFPPPEGGRCLDIGCGFGDTTQRLAELVGPEGFALGTDSSPHFIEDARREAAEAGCENVAFEVADAQTAEWEPAYDYAFSRMGTQFFAMPVAAMRAIRGALVPGGSAPQGLLAAQGREPDLGGDRAGRPALPLAPRDLRRRHLRPRAVLARQPRDHARHPRGRRVRGDRAAPQRLRLLPRRGTWTRRSRPCSRSGPAPS